jgi:hypothetical protein
MTLQEKSIALINSVLACSWLPHWSCHYYTLETHTQFIVNDYTYTRTDSYLSLILYSVLSGLNILSINYKGLRRVSWSLTACGHLSISTFHIFRLLYGFPFIVFDQLWPISASLRETLIILPLGLLSTGLAVGYRPLHNNSTAGNVIKSIQNKDK